MSSQSQNNFNIQNKLVKIDGEYVKLYVTTNKTLPKLLKNTGSLIVYHDGVLSNTNDNTPINYLYLGNNLISSGWGLHKEVQRNDTEYFFNYGNDYNQKHIGASDEFNHNYYDIIHKLYEKNSFWGDKTLANEYNLVDEDVIQKYKLFFNGENQNTTTFTKLYNHAGVFSTINDIISRICNKNIIDNTKFVPYNEPLTNPKNTFAPYLYQDINKSFATEDNISKYYLTQFTESNSETKINLENSVYRRKIYLDMIPYMLGPAKYDKPEVKDIDVKIYYKYSKNENKGVYFDNFGEFVANKVNGKYRLPKGAIIYKIVLNMDVKMNDGKKISECSFDYMITTFNEAKGQLNSNQSDTTNKISNIVNTLLFDEKIDLSNVNIKNDYKTFSQSYKTAKVKNIALGTSKYGVEYNSIKIEYTLGDELSIPIANEQFVKNISLTIKGVNKLKKYAAFDDDNKFGYFYNPTTLNSVSEAQNNAPIYSFEYAWTTTKIDVPFNIEIEPMDIVFVGTKSYSTTAVEQSKYGFSIMDLFGSCINIGTIYNNYTKKMLNTPLKSKSSTELYDDDIIMIGVPKGKSIKNIYANIELVDGVHSIIKTNITGLLKYIANVNYFISLNPEMNKYDNDSETYRYAAISDLETNVFSQPYNVYFCLLPRTYNRSNSGKMTDNSLTSFEIEFDDEYNSILNNDYLNSVDTWSTCKNYNKRGSVNSNIVTSTDTILDNIDMTTIIFSNEFKVSFVSNSEYDGNHIFNLSMNIDNLSNTKLDEIGTINPLSQFIKKDNKEAFIKKYCDKLNNLSL